MNIHEYQAKELFRKHGVSVPKGKRASNASDAERIADSLIRETGDESVVIKAQILAGGRGKAGGIKVVRGAAAARSAAEALLHRRLITHQTGPHGEEVKDLLIEQGMEIARELYLAVVVDRESRRLSAMASTEGGMEIEEVAAAHPEKISKVMLDPTVGLMPFQVRFLSSSLELTKDESRAFGPLLSALVAFCQAEDCGLVEINPLVVTKDRAIVALDAKVNLDDNAEFRHPEWKALVDLAGETSAESEAKAAGLSYIQLDGDIACVVNGAGLAMATMDIIKHFGGEPANFLDVGGGASQESVTQAFRIVLRSTKVKGIFVNIFGGIMKCDIIAAAIVAANKELGLKVPLVVRLEGTRVDEGKRILSSSGLGVTAVDGMAEGARRIVQVVGGKSS